MNNDLLKIEMSEPGKSSILTLMLQHIIEKNLADPFKRALLRGRQFTTVIHAGRMKTLLAVGGGKIRLLDIVQSKPDLEVRGTIRALLDLAVGRSVLAALARRQISLRVALPRGLCCWIYVLGLLRQTPFPRYLTWLVRRLPARRRTEMEGFQ